MFKTKKKLKSPSISLLKSEVMLSAIYGRTNRLETSEWNKLNMVQNKISTYIIFKRQNFFLWVQFNATICGYFFWWGE